METLKLSEKFKLGWSEILITIHIALTYYSRYSTDATREQLKELAQDVRRAIVKERLQNSAQKRSEKQLDDFTTFACFVNYFRMIIHFLF